jgi:deoxyadenosine kinase
MGSEVFCGIAGIIGAGKTTLTLDLARALDAEAYLEPVVENPYLADFYKEKDRYGFTMQIYLLNERFRQHQEVVWRRRRAIQDRTIYEDTIFAEMLREAGYMTARDYETYINLFTNMTHFLQRPTVILYLDTTPEHALENVTARARGCETGLPLDYLRDLRAGYEKWYERMKNRLTIVRVPWDDFGKSLDMASLVREYAPDARWGQKF